MVAPACLSDCSPTWEAIYPELEGAQRHTNAGCRRPSAGCQKYLSQVRGGQAGDRAPPRNVGFSRTDPAHVSIWSCRQHRALLTNRSQNPLSPLTLESPHFDPR